MILYDFYTNMTSAPIVNTISKWLPGVKLVDYKIDLISGDKIFTLGYEGEVFDFIVSKEDVISIVKHVAMTHSQYIGKLKKFYSVFDHTVMNEIHSILLQSFRSHKINTIFN